MPNTKIFSSPLKRKFSLKNLLFLGSFLFLFLFSPNFALAAGGGGWADIGWKAFNLLVLVGVVTYFFGGKIKGGLSSIVAERQKKVAKVLGKHQQSLGKLEEHQIKLEGLEEELKELAENNLTKAEEEKALAVKQAQETATLLQKQAEERFAQEKEKMEQETRRKVLGAVLAQTRTLLAEQGSSEAEERIFSQVHHHLRGQK